MIEFEGQGVLLDIEGTTSSVSFVYDVMFPFARRELEAYLRDNWGRAALNEASQMLASDAGFDSAAAWYGEKAVADEELQLLLVRDEAIRLMDGDVKATGLKQLQGLIWRAGFESGEMQAHLYDDVPAALDAWRAAGGEVRIYSSGSIAAQKLFFGHTIAGDLLDRFSGHYDTTTGPKREAASYETIATAFNRPAGEILFLSDTPAELDAAKAAGLQTGLCLRPGNAEVSADHGHAEIRSFAEVKLTASA